MTLLRICHRTLICLVLASAFLVTLTTVKAEEKAKGTLTYKGPKKTFTVALTHAYLVKGPDTFEEGKIIRRLVFTTSDFTAAIKKADALNGFDGELVAPTSKPGACASAQSLPLRSWSHARWRSPGG